MKGKFGTEGRQYVCGLVSMLGERLQRYWKISIHWLIAVKYFLSKPFTVNIAKDSALRCQQQSCRTVLGYTSLITCILTVCLLSLWPFDFNFFNSNNVRFIETTDSIEFSGIGQVLSLTPMKNFYSRMISGSGISVEIWISAKNVSQSGPARIVSYSLNPYMRNFTLAQSKDKLMIRLRTTETDLNGIFPHLEVSNVFVSSKILHIVVSYDYFEQSAYVDGKLRARKQLPGGRFTNWDDTYLLSIGNEITGDRPWIGKIFFIAIYNRPLIEQEVYDNYLAGWFVKDKTEYMDKRVSSGLVACYTFKEKYDRIIPNSCSTDNSLDLFIPPKVIWNHDKFFLNVSNLSLLKSSKFDLVVVLHIIAFLPIGFLGYHLIIEHLNSSLKALGLVFILGTLIAVSIEALQHFLPTRHSSLLDLFSHILGLILGVASCKLLFRNLKNEA